MNFKAGDKVKCVNIDGLSSPSIVLGSVYTVEDTYESADRTYLRLMNEADYYSRRFELVPESVEKPVKVPEEIAVSLSKVGCLVQLDIRGNIPQSKVRAILDIVYGVSNESN